MKVRKAVIPAAGLGTRFLPATKAQPKEMLPIIDKPVIQFVVEEAIASGIEDILIVTGRGKRAIEDHFDNSFELVEFLKKRGKPDLVKKLEGISKLADIHFIRQKNPKGLGDAISCAKTFVGKEPFAVLLGDDIIKSDIPCTKQLINIYEKHKSSVIAVEKISKEKIHTKGIIKIKVSEGDGLYLLEDLIEKPPLPEAPSDLGIAGRYVLTSEVFDCLKRVKPGFGGEIQLTDAIRMLNSSQKVYGYEFKGTRYDIGNLLDFVKTTIDFALKRKDLSKEVKNYIRNLKV
ncbi:MAG: UTP--glucose-1-phosphate uridylyltransferase GalU [Candidatus Aenigmatarchaeota archaeon]|nr:MAG: UTP--glucose-1-phosphate uridylyltransferase GalU [Candidatus Aenigmarchaeota archaeon]